MAGMNFQTRSNTMLYSKRENVHCCYCREAVQVTVQLVSGSIIPTAGSRSPPYSLL
ncbi:hypothetical protein [Hungatella effluvii]|uniref:hypothetical protein n=1 Tax=Hungatella effluvii TaxID=1096246 RepID=UPI002A837BC4|nr:hypothetical protein [Hungatella effluvii]